MKRLSLLLLLVLLASCSTHRPRDAKPVDGLSWSVQGRMIVDNGSAKRRLSFQAWWSYDEKEIRIWHTLAGQQWLLNWQGGQLLMTNGKGLEYRQQEAERYITRELGLEIPFEKVFATLAAPELAGLMRLEPGFDGWVLAYSGMNPYESIHLPGSIDIQRTPYRISMTLKNWTVTGLESAP